MFFSRVQTLSISVNVVGIMGKGLASRAKYASKLFLEQLGQLGRRAGGKL